MKRHDAIDAKSTRGISDELNFPKKIIIKIMVKLEDLIVPYRSKLGHI